MMHDPSLKKCWAGYIYSASAATAAATASIIGTCIYVCLNVCELATDNAPTYESIYIYIGGGGLQWRRSWPSLTRLEREIIRQKKLGKVRMRGGGFAG